MKEIIEVDEEQMMTRFELKDHPKYEGFIKNTIETEDADSYLTYELQWEAHQGTDDGEKVKASFEKAVYGTKEAAEEVK